GSCRSETAATSLASRHRRAPRSTLRSRTSEDRANRTSRSFPPTPRCSCHRSSRSPRAEAPRVQRYLLVLRFAAMSDDPRLEPALATVWPGRATVVVPIEAGITNRNYRVDVDGETFVLRLAGTDTELLGIDRAAEVEAGRVAAAAGVGPEVVAFEPDLGCIVTRFVDGSPIPEDQLGDEAVMRSLVASIRAIHGSRPIRATFPVFRIVEGFRDVAAARGVQVPADYEAAHAVAARIDEA